MSSGKLFKTAQLTLADFDLHLIQDLTHLLIRNSKIFGNFEAHGAGKFSLLGFCQYGFLHLLTVHGDAPFQILPSPFPSPPGGEGGVRGIVIIFLLAPLKYKSRIQTRPPMPERRLY
jgi:hypothetical protein